MEKTKNCKNEKIAFLSAIIFYKNFFNTVILAIRDSVQWKLEDIWKNRWSIKSKSQNKRQRTWFYDKFDKNLKWLPFQHGLAQMTQT